jgi:hypothetical protein
LLSRKPENKERGMGQGWPQLAGFLRGIDKSSAIVATFCVRETSKGWGRTTAELAASIEINNR